MEVNLYVGHKAAVFDGSIEEVAGQSPWVACVRSEFSTCRVNGANPPAPIRGSLSVKPT